MEIVARGLNTIHVSCRQNAISGVHESTRLMLACFLTSVTNVVAEADISLFWKGQESWPLDVTGRSLQGSNWRQAGAMHCLTKNDQDLQVYGVLDMSNNESCLV